MGSNCIKHFKFVHRILKHAKDLKPRRGNLSLHPQFTYNIDPKYCTYPGINDLLEVYSHGTEVQVLVVLTVVN